MTSLCMRLKLVGRWLRRRLPGCTPQEASQVSRSELWPKVHDLIVRHVGEAKRPISPKTDFAADLGFDSLDSVELVLSLEEELGLEIPDEAMRNLKTVADLLDYLEGRMHGNRSIGG